MCQPPPGLSLNERLSGAQGRRQSARDDLSNGMSVILGRPHEQFEQCGVQGRFLIDCALDRAQLRVRRVRRVAALQNDANDPPPAERRPYSLADLDRRPFGRAIVERPPQGRIDREAKKGRAGQPNLCSNVDVDAASWLPIT